jgi:hypothetical protein
MNVSVAEAPGWRLVRYSSVSARDSFICLFLFVCLFRFHKCVIYTALLLLCIHGVVSVRRVFMNLLGRIVLIVERARARAHPTNHPTTHPHTHTHTHTQTNKQANKQTNKQTLLHKNKQGSRLVVLR